MIDTIDDSFGDHSELLEKIDILEKKLWNEILMFKETFELVENHDTAITVEDWIENFPKKYYTILLCFKCIKNVNTKFKESEVNHD